MQMHISNFFNSYTLKQIIFSIFLSFSIFLLYQIQYYQKINIEKENSMREMINAPVSLWYRLDYFHIPDFYINEDPEMFVERVIGKPFFSTWHIELEKITSSGAISVCTVEGAGNFTTESKLPTNLKLSWWLGGKNNLDKCLVNKTSDDDDYRLVTRKIIMPNEDGYPNKKHISKSNIFKITNVR